MLPIEPFLDEIVTLVNKHSVVLLRATPGSGKTTRVPDYLNQRLNYKTLVLEPRRVAATNAAQFIAESRKEVVGQSVGYQVRFESVQNGDTNVLFVTEALLLKFLISDSDLSRFNCVIIDEFHERALYTDVALGLLRDLLKRRSDLRIVIMSATVDDQDLRQFFQDIFVFDVSGTIYPLKVIHHHQPQLIRIDPNWYLKMQDLILKAFFESLDGSLLVFLPGRGECEQLKKDFYLFSP
jgi:HrpA-like RNA helicase